ncbi:cyclin pho80-like protein [Diplodia corticola]|uniref:Cyclin pho80-like protein n=1 Tax=Diplodia corticola TaxID=236234 RepID=A0A1J9QZ27_9PEZI|nr:cyclin pho80-like protein [Diplodia corticola]OJD33242.1 cyclin pho80-like protein [Diplodia corticola]
MPHALALDRSQPAPVYPPARTHKPQHEQLPLRDSRSLYAPGESWQARPSALGNPAAPPVDMTSVQRGHNALPQPASSYAVQRPGDAAFVTKPQHVHQAPEANTKAMTASLRPAYQNGPQPVYRPQSPSARGSSNNTTSEDYRNARRASNQAIAASLQIPTSILTPQTSMPQLAAEITCLFWFENSSTLHQALDSLAPPPTGLVPDAQPTTGFRKWVTTILSTTQVTQNVVILALLFIYRLKTINPGVKGKPGSEYRLLTVALMLGNKFLDDNTYTNKTWADVSGISVQEVHIMEVEFLSNMKYNLFTSAEEWSEWHVTLGRFGTFFERASRAPSEASSRALGPPTPTLRVPPNLPSPPHSTQASPPFLNGFSPNNNNSYSNTPTLLPQISSAAVSPIGPLPELNLRPGSRKRSYDDQAQEPAPKRALRHFAPTENQPAYASVPPQSGPTQPAAPHPTTSIPPMLPPLPNLSVPQLPPPNTRSNSLVYPPPMQWSQPSSMPPAPAATLPPALSIPQSQPSAPGPSRQLSPLPTESAASSPLHPGFGPGAPKQNRLSPSFYLSQRSSPYRPVRTVNTLLVPPPSTSISHPPRLGFDQMQYQPLGRPSNERRLGPLPYMNHDAWPTTNQFNQWPVLPQPNFSR